MLTAVPYISIYLQLVYYISYLYLHYSCMIIKFQPYKILDGHFPVILTYYCSTYLNTDHLCRAGTIETRSGLMMTVASALLAGKLHHFYIMD